MLTLVGSGDEKNAVILLSAHLDHLGARDTGVDRIYNGADDDASGSIAVLALAEALAKGKSLQRSVVFAWFGSEEVGGYGARYFVEKTVGHMTQAIQSMLAPIRWLADSSFKPDRVHGGRPPAN